jgi:hypothetical protein
MKTFLSEVESFCQDTFGSGYQLMIPDPNTHQVIVSLYTEKDYVISYLCGSWYAQDNINTGEGPSLMIAWAKMSKK